ncbi:hypothetical protein JCM19241_2972 [Vibrio ishigakensis]|uniref:Orotidine-5'-phosphate decarboxylase n=1 Tax=Vibrio ishigakensis TaxID=1481914 RepID=A0A0B8Q9C9_9VIBR|nr:hypothetical protein JCM19241_2972 [Vibrio ishigakensis]
MMLNLWRNHMDQKVIVALDYDKKDDALRFVDRIDQLLVA